jgi:hypothetical protein
MGESSKLPLFLGVCERALIRGDGVMQDLYGFGDMLPLAFFPQNLQGVYLVIALHRDNINSEVKITLKSKTRPEVTAWRNLTPYTGAVLKPPSVIGYKQPYQVIKETSNKNESGAITPLLTRSDFIYKTFCIPCPPLIVMEPTDIDVLVNLGSTENKIGTFRCEFVETPTISEEERTAIMSRLSASAGIKLILGCKNCGETKGFYILLNPNGPVPEDFKNDMPLMNASDEWNCRCGQSKASLVYAKRGLHEVFRISSLKGGHDNLEYKPLYQRGALAAIAQEYQHLIMEHTDDEEIVQKFLEDKQILWNFLAPKRIWKKPPILSKYKADFAILNPHRILYFVEIETPSTKLSKKRGGGLHSELQAGLDQIRDWKKEVSDRREAVLDGLGLKQQDVHDVKFILIAGMAAKTPTEDLAKLRSMSSDADSIFCFDDLASFLYSTEVVLLNI